MPQARKGDKMKAEIKLKDFLTLVGPAQQVRVIDEEADSQEGGQVLYKGVAAKARDGVDTGRLIKFIIPETPPEEGKSCVLKVYI